MKTSSTRSGFSLAEVLVATVLLGVVGGALTKLVVSQMRFFDNVNAVRGARSVARNSMNILLSDLRMVQDQDGLIAASADSVKVRVPYNVGVFCGTVATISTVSMLPVDSAVLAFSKYAGYAWRNDTTRTYTVVTPADPVASVPVVSAAPTLCTTTAGIKLVTINDRVGRNLDITPVITGRPVGTAVFFFQTITYRFGTSTLFPGKIGLWRSVANGGVTEEMMAPFDASARFKFYTAGSDTSQATVPSPLNNITGLDIILTAVGARLPAGRTSPVQAKMVSSVFFKNVR